MKTWRRFVISATLATMALAPAGPPSWGQTAPPSSELDPGALVPEGAELDSGTEVHSWALAPAFGDEAEGGNRPNLSYEAAPGTEVNDDVTLFNYSNVQLTFRLYATDAFNNEDGSFDLLPGDQPPTGVGTWVTLPQANITLAPRSQATMPITVRVPVTARPGDHAGGILASSQAEGTGPDGKVVALDRRTGSRLYIRVAGPLVPQLTVEKLRTTYGPALSPLGGTAEVTYRVENRGNVRMGGRQQVSVSGPFGVARKRMAATDLSELLPGEGVDMRVRFTGVAATIVAVGNVRLEPAPVGDDAKGGAANGDAANNRRSFALALPFTVLAMALVGWLLSRARRNYQRRRDSGSNEYAAAGAHAR